MDDKSEAERRFETYRISRDLDELKESLRVKSDKDDITRLQADIRRLEGLIAERVTLDRFRATELLSWSAIGAMGTAVLAWMVNWFSNGQS